jgi:hypothetical protein
MKKLIFYIIAAILIFTACNKEEIPVYKTDQEVAVEQLGEVCTLSLTVNMQEETNTRVALTQDESSNITLTWEEGDELQLCFVQDDNKVKRVVTVNNISNEGRKASFDVVVPTEFGDSNFDLYGVYGGGGLLDSDPTIAVLPTASSSVSSLNSLSDGEYTMLRFSSKGIAANSSVSVTFQHIGSLFCLTLKNATADNIENMGEARITSTIGGWAYNSAESGKSYNLVTETFLDVETSGNYISLYADGAIAADNTLSFWGWYPPLTDVNWPELRLQLYNKSDVLIGSSSNVKPAKTTPTVAGKCFYFYAVMNDAGLHFTDNSYTAPLNIEDLTIEGNLRHAVSGTDFIGMVYTRAGNVYYNQAELNGEWKGEILLGAGTDPRIAIDGNDNPHVVYVDAGKIVYRMNDGASFSEPNFIETNFAGTCSKPDIAVDGSGFAHITYTDSRGNTGNYTDYPDIMYAVNSSGSFIKTLIYNGYYESYGGADAGADYFDKGSRIAVDATGRYFILAHKYDFYKWSNGNDKNYSVIVNSGTANGSGGGTYKYDREDIYDLAFDGTNVIAFYKTGNVVNTAQLAVTDNTITFINTQQVVAPLSNSYTTPATLLALPNNRVLGGISGGKVFTKYGAVEEVSDKTVKNETVVVATQCGGNIYTAYTGSTDGVIRLIKRAE